MANTKKRRIWIFMGIILALLVGTFATSAGRMLVVNDPQRSDVILVLAGETERRPARALELLGQGYGRRVVIDVPAVAMMFHFTEVELAEQYGGSFRRRPQSGSVPSRGFRRATKPATLRNA